MPLALGVAIGRRHLPPRYWLLGALASIAPDVDVAAFAFGIPYDAPFGHRGASHSIVFAFFMAALGTWREWRAFRDHTLLFATCSRRRYLIRCWIC